MNRKGFLLKEIIFLSAILAVIFALLITRVSFAYSTARREDDVSYAIYNPLIVAAEAYVKARKDEFKDDEIFVYGSDLIDANYLIDIEEFDYKNKKIKVIYDKTYDKYTATIVE